MKLQHLQPEIPNRGLYVKTEFDPRGLEQGYVADINNMSVTLDGAEKRRGYVKYPNSTTFLPLTVPIVGLTSLVTSADLKYLFAHTYYGTFIYDSTNGNWGLLYSGLISSCEAGWVNVSNSTITFPTTGHMEGAKCLKAVFSAGGSCTLTGLTLDDTNFTAHNLMFWIKGSIANTANVVVTLTRASGDFTKTFTAGQVTTSWALTHEAYGTPNDENITAITITTNEAITIYLDDVCIVPDLDSASTDAIRSICANNKAFWTNNYDLIEYWSSGRTISQITDANGPTQAKVIFLSPHGDRFHALNTNNGVNCDHWTAAASQTDFTTSGADWTLMSDSGDPIEACISFEAGRDVIYRRISMWERIYVGGDTIYQYRPIFGGFGTPAGRTCRRCGEYHIWLGWKSVYMYDGQSVTDIGMTIKRRLVEELDLTNISRNFALVNESKFEYYLFTVPLRSDYPNRVWVYNWKYQTWSIFNYTDDILSGTEAVFSTAGTSVAWENAEGTWASQEGSWIMAGEYGYQDALMLGDYNGNVFQISLSETNDNDEEVESYFITRAFTFNDLEQQDRWLKFSFVASGSTVKVAYSTNLGETWMDEQEFTLASERKLYEYFINTRGRQIQFRFTNSESNGALKLYSYYPSGIPVSIRHDVETATT